MSEPIKVDFAPVGWPDDHDGWDTDGPIRLPGIRLMGHAIQVWSILQDRERVTTAEAAAAFNVPERVIREAVGHHYWMFLQPADDGTTLIEHEGDR